MTKEEKLLQFLYRNEEIRTRLINDVYQELLEVVPPTLCFNSKNVVNSTRDENLRKALSSISNFLENNADYNKVIKEIYDEDFQFVLCGYMFYLSHTNEKYISIDIFKNKKSILYSEISLLDIL